MAGTEGREGCPRRGKFNLTPHFDWAGHYITIHYNTYTLHIFHYIHYIHIQSTLFPSSVLLCPIYNYCGAVMTPTHIYLLHCLYWTAIIKPGTPGHGGHMSCGGSVKDRSYIDLCLDRCLTAIYLHICSISNVSHLNLV